MRFSERHGYKPIREIVQIESIDEPLRNALWNLLKVHAWDTARYIGGMSPGYYLTENTDLQKLCHELWFSYFKAPLDQLDNDWREVLAELRKYFFESKWYEVYDFVEFVQNNYPRYGFKEPFTRSCNVVLEREMSAYRFVNGSITRITEQHEIAEIEKVLDRAAGPVSTHIRRALELLSDRSKPDYRNSIKESISAVEGLVRKVLGDNGGTLGQLINRLEIEFGLHPALKSAFSNLYGYTSDEGGIRHALMEMDKVDFDDAKLMLVVCSAFINFVQSKTQAG